MQPTYVYDIDAPPAVSVEELPRLLGGKAANLVVMARHLELPVPPGFTITTEASRAYLAGRWPDGLDAQLRDHVERLSQRLGRRFGDVGDPLLVSVRSGAPVSMPGMMDTVLNLGLNEATAGGLAATTGDQEFAADCLRRLRKNYREVIGNDAPDDPWLQLRAAIEAVFSSWNSERARAYRRREDIANDLGTGVTVQAMVFGNRGPESATGVLFTRNPSTGEPALYGDVMFNAQGEDVVGGGHATQPLSALDERLPQVGAELRRHADRLERHFADLCDIEFTVEQGRLWLLQVRVGKRSPQAALRMAIDMAREEAFPCSREEGVRRVAHLLADPPRVFVRAADAPAPIARGLPASPGVATGVIATSSDAAEAFADQGRSAVLVRRETSPEDVRGMARAAGVLTSRGGLTSHAAVVARGWGIPAVVGAEEVRLDGEAVDIAGHRFAAGDRITIDGGTGEVFAGEVGGNWQIAPEAETLLDWARELDIDVAAAAAPASEAEPASSEAATLTPGDASPLTDEDVLRTLLIKGLAETDVLAASLTGDPADVEGVVGRLAGDGLAETPAGGLRLSTEGKLRALDLFAQDRAVVGEERSGTLLEEFHALDMRMKSIVTAWQMREVGDEQVFNDHTDAAYDSAVLDDLAGLHDEAVAWLSPLGETLPRYAIYRARLTAALEQARAGDQRFVASPRVDSYHSVWFELHEDLIRLAGRRRSDEAAAGRA